MGIKNAKIKTAVRNVMVSNADLLWDSARNGGERLPDKVVIELRRIRGFETISIHFVHHLFHTIHALQKGERQ